MITLLDSAFATSMMTIATVTMTVSAVMVYSTSSTKIGQCGMTSEVQYLDDITLSLAAISTILSVMLTWIAFSLSSIAKSLKNRKKNRKNYDR